MKFAFLIMGTYDKEIDRAFISNDMAQIIGVANLDEACVVAKDLCYSGVDCIELCGAFGAEGAKKIIEVTDNKIPIGYVTHLPEQDEIYRLAFSK